MANFQTMSYNTISFVVDAAKTGLSTTAIDLGEIPAGFVVNGVAVEQLTTASAAKAVVLKAKTADIQLGKDCTLGASTTMTKQYDAAVNVSGYINAAAGTAAGTDPAVTVGGSKEFKAADTLTCKVSADTVTSGKFVVTLVGLFPFAAPISSAGNNKADVDPYTPPEKA